MFVKFSLEKVKEWIRQLIKDIRGHSTRQLYYKEGGC